MKQGVEKFKKEKESKLINKLYALTVFILAVCILAGSAVYYFSQNVTAQSESLESTAAFQQDYTRLVNGLKQVSLIKYQLATGGYNENLIETMEVLLNETSMIYGDLETEIAGNEELSHYFAYLNDVIESYESTYTDYFSSIFVGDDVDHIRSRVTPVITRNEESINTVNERMENYLEAEREAASTSLHESIAITDTVIMVALLVLIIVPFISLMLFGRSLKYGVNLVMNRINAYNRGQLDYGQEHSRNDEFARIDKRLQSMGSDLFRLLQSNEKVSGDVLSVARGTSDMSVKQLGAMKRINETMTDLSDEMEKQTDYTGTISATAEEVSAGSEEIQSSVEHMTTQMKELEKGSQQGLQLMGELESVMNHLHRETGAASGKVKGMQGQLEHISSFLSGIDDIAEQTNLLAINASIEAAKAGKEGRSFSVVADEIRKLSKGTNDFSGRTKEVLQKLLSETDDVAEAFAHFQTHSDKALEKTIASAKLFKTFSAENSDITRRYSEISEAIGQINAAIDEVVNSVTELADSAGLLQERSESVRNIVSEQTGTQEKLTNEVMSLEGLAERLKGSA